MMKILEAEDVRVQLTMPVCIDLMKTALIKLETGQGVQPPRTIHTLPGENLFGFMPAWMDDCFGAKIVAAIHGNIGTEYPSHIGYIMIFESEHGVPMGLAEAGAVTAIRTAAVSAVATELLAHPEAEKLAVIGCGVQGRSHMEAMNQVRPIREVFCYDIDPARTEAFAVEQSALYGIPVRTACSVQEAAADADIICTLTPSTEPILEAEWVKAGAHINAVGAFQPTKRELTSQLIASSRLYADDVSAMKREAGEYLIPLAEGLIDENHIVGSLGEVLLGRAPGRRSREEITVFSALGLAVEDVICGRFLLCG